MFLLQEIARHLQEKEALKLERARQRRLERQQREEREAKMLQEAITGLHDHDENDMNQHEQAETQRGLIGTYLFRTIFNTFLQLVLIFIFLYSF